MARQISFDDILPDDYKRRVLHFADEEYLQARDEDESLPTVKNRHEAYGILAEAMVLLKGMMSLVDSAVKDSLASLPGTSEGFYEAVDMGYNGLIAVAQAAIHMAVQAQNISLTRVRAAVDVPGLLADVDGDFEALPEVPDGLLEEDDDHGET